MADMYEKFSKSVVDELYFEHKEAQRVSKARSLYGQLTLPVMDVPAIYSTGKMNFSKKLYSQRRVYYGNVAFTCLLNYLSHVNYRKFTANVKVNDALYYINSKQDLGSLLDLLSEGKILRSLTRLGYVLSPKGTKESFISTYFYLLLFKYAEKILVPAVKHPLANFNDEVKSYMLRLSIGEAFLNGVYEYGVHANYKLPLVESVFKIMSEAITYEKENKNNLTDVVIFEITRENNTKDIVKVGIASRDRQERFLVYFLGALEDVCRFSFEPESDLKSYLSGALLNPKYLKLTPLTANDRINVRFS